MTLPIDLPEARRILREVVADAGPEFVYSRRQDDEGYDEDCKYVHESPEGEKTPGCIVGAVLHKAGVSLADLEGLEGFTIIDLPWSDREQVITAGFHEWVTLDAACYLRTAQRSQDRLSSWGEALTAAEAAFPE